MEEDLISVIVPVYNVEEYLPKCLECISNQTYRNLEIILVDDGSTDSSGRLCDEFAARDTRTRVIHQDNKGLWVARNTGQDAARGDYLWFPDGDDYFHHSLLELMHRAINYKGNAYPLSICHAKQTDNSNEKTDSEIRTPHYSIMSKEDLYLKLYMSFEVGWPNQWNKLYRKVCLNDLHSRNFVRGQDRDFQARFFSTIENAVLIDTVLYYWRQHSTSLTSNQNTSYYWCECGVRSTFNNYINLDKSQRRYRHYYLYFLYRRMAFWKAYAYGTEKRRAVFKEVAFYAKKTLMDYLTCGHEPFGRKLLILLGLCYPRIVIFLINKRSISL